jgi:hypothetical protein
VGVTELEHDGNSADCWCQPDKVHPCPVCVSNEDWDGLPDLDPTAYKNPLDFVHELADGDCERCLGTGVVSYFSDAERTIFIHR